MEKKNRDVKFLIYQSLYIFLISVVAIKGADINLDEVEVKKLMEPNYTYIDTANNVVMSKSQFTDNYIIKFDTNAYVLLTKNQYIEMKKNDPTTPEPISLNIGPGKYSDPLTITGPPIKVTANKLIPVFPGTLDLTQYTSASINNPSNQDLEIIGIGTIAGNTTKTIEIGGQSTIAMKIGDETKTFPVKPNEKPVIEIQRIVNMGENAHASNLQRSTCYRVKIKDDFPGQLEVKFSGPVTVKQQGNTYDVTMNAFGSKTSFDNYAENLESPYKLGFVVTVTDKKAGHNQTGQQTFVFGEW